MANSTLDILWGLQCKRFKVCLAIFQHYAQKGQDLYNFFRDSVYGMKKTLDLDFFVFVLVQGRKK